jgi:REP element-mobilizing transposase RayT
MPPELPSPGVRMLRRGRHSFANGVYHVTTATAVRNPVFRDFDMARAASASIVSSESLGDTLLLAWVLMPDHMHLLLQLGARDPLPLVVCRIKARSAAAANRVMQRRGAIWARGFHDHALRCEEDMRTVARYIVANPIRAGLARHCGDYPFWDAAWLS